MVGLFSLLLVFLQFHFPCSVFNLQNVDHHKFPGPSDGSELVEHTMDQVVLPFHPQLNRKRPNYLCFFIDRVSIQCRSCQILSGGSYQLVVHTDLLSSLSADQPTTNKPSNQPTSTASRWGTFRHSIQLRERLS